MLEISIPDLVFAIVNFVILMAILRKFLWGPVMKTMDERQKGITDSLEKAAVAKKEADETHAVLAGEIENARRQAKAIVDEAQQAGEAVKSDIIDQAQKSASDMITRAQAEIEQQKLEAIAQLKGEVADLVVITTGKLLGENMSEEQHKVLMDKYIAEVGDR